MGKRYYIKELLKWLAFFTSTYCYRKSWYLEGAVFVGLFGGIAYSQGRDYANRKMQQTVDEMVWVKVKQAKDADPNATTQGEH
jgi:hypothetical protein